MAVAHNPPRTLLPRVAVEVAAVDTSPPTTLAVGVAVGVSNEEVVVKLVATTVVNVGYT